MKKNLSILILLITLLLFSVGVSAETSAPQIDGLQFVAETPMTYAQGFHLYQYEGGYTLISIQDGADFLVIPQGAPIPANLDANITALQQPIDRIYLAATSAMALFDAVDAVDAVQFTGTQASGWYIDSAVDALNAGRMQFAGRYSEPDYEHLLIADCNLAIESTMIYHTPKVKERLEALGIPVLVDRSSYETHPLGRTEWIKLYAVLTDKEAEAEAFFNDQAVVIERLKDYPNSEKTVAFFYVNSDGSIVVRNPLDYIPQMIELGGGQYLCPALSAKETGTSVSVTMESFYSSAWDADFLIYNSAIDAPLDSIKQLLDKDSLFADFKAVQEGTVWCTGRSFYQATDIVGQMIWDIHNMLTDADESQMTFLTRVN